MTDSEAVHLRLVLFSGVWGSAVYWYSAVGRDPVELLTLMTSSVFVAVFFFCRAVGTDQPLCIYKKLCCDSACVRINLQVHHLFFLFCAEAELKQT